MPRLIKKAVVDSVRHWSTMLEACHTPFTIYSYHQSLQYFRRSQRLLPRHVRWSQDLNAHLYNIQYRPAEQNGTADALSRRPNLDTPLDNIIKPLLRPVKVLALHVPLGPIASHATGTPSIEDYITAANAHNPFLSATPRDPHLSAPDISPPLYNGKLYVPDNPALRFDIIRLAHDGLDAGHRGRDPTIKLIKRTYAWPGLTSMVQRYVASGNACQKGKPAHHRPYGKLRPLPTPARSWSSILWDHIGPPQVQRLRFRPGHC